MYIYIYVFLKIYSSIYAYLFVFQHSSSFLKIVDTKETIKNSGFSSETSLVTMLSDITNRDKLRVDPRSFKLLVLRCWNLSWNL